jgi:integrase/recombinase XerD
VISPAEFEQLLAQPRRRAPTGSRNAAVLSVMWDAGLRVSEVCDLAPGDLIRSGGNAQTLRVRRGKGGKDRSNLGVPHATWALLERWAAARPTSRWFFSTLAGNRLSPRYIEAMTSRYAARAGVYKLDDRNERRPIHPHLLRHSYATRLIQVLPIHDVQRAVGHANLATTARYLHVEDCPACRTAPRRPCSRRGGRAGGRPPARPARTGSAPGRDAECRLTRSRAGCGVPSKRSPTAPPTRLPPQ